MGKRVIPTTDTRIPLKRKTVIVWNEIRILIVVLLFVLSYLFVLENQRMPVGPWGRKFGVSGNHLERAGEEERRVRDREERNHPESRVETHAPGHSFPPRPAKSSVRSTKSTNL